MTTRTRYSLFLVLVILLAGLVVGSESTLAASDTFTVGLNISNDFVPPSIPAPINVSPVSSSQIDISWGASTDNDILAGYRLFRDGVQIATTTLTSYSDTGLTASTTYSYFVNAFDSVFNTSTSSVTVATTTLALPVATTTPTSTPSGSGGGSTRVTPRLLDFSVTTTDSTATLYWQTNVPVRYVVRWGQTSGYELGSVSNGVWQSEHQTTITGLAPDTLYNYEIVVYSTNGRATVLRQGQFTTQTSPDTKAPVNVINLQATVSRPSVELTWDYPPESDITQVRVVRNYRFYPTDPVDGYIVYTGRGTQVVDSQALADRPSQYYTVFAYDAAGNVSSGATIRVVSAEVVNPSGEGSATTSPTLPDGSATTSFDFSGITFVQDENKITPINGLVSIRASVPFTVMVPVLLLPATARTLVITLETEGIPARNYLLRMNKDQSGYEAALAGLVAGTYQVSIVGYDARHFAVAESKGVVQAVAVAGELVGNIIPLPIDQLVYLGLLLFLLLVGLWLFLFILKRRREEESEDKLGV